MKRAPLVIGLIAATQSCRTSLPERFDVVTIEDRAIASAAPGETVTLRVVGNDGRVSVVALRTGDDGVVTRARPRLGLARLGAEQPWILDTSKLPRGLAASATEADIVAVMGDRSYRGRTNRRANVGHEVLCQERDDTSVVSFGRLPDGVLAVSCEWHRGDRPLERDIRIQRDAELRVSGSSSRRGHSIAELATVLAPAASKLSRGRGTNDTWR